MALSIIVIDFNNLVGEKFQLVNIPMLGAELGAPCERPTQLLGRPNFMEAFEGKGDVRTEVLNSGILTVGDKLIVENETRLHTATTPSSLLNKQ